MPLSIHQQSPAVKAVYRQPLKSWGLINAFLIPALSGWGFHTTSATQAFWVCFAWLVIFLISTGYLLDRFFGRTHLTCGGSELKIEHYLFLKLRSQTFNLMTISEPYLTQEQWVRLRIPWLYELPARMRFESGRGWSGRSKRISCCRRMTEAELWELLSAIRKANPTIDRLWDSIPAPVPAPAGPLNI